MWATVYCKEARTFAHIGVEPTITRQSVVVYVWLATQVVCRLVDGHVHWPPKHTVRYPSTVVASFQLYQLLINVSIEETSCCCCAKRVAG